MWESGKPGYNSGRVRLASLCVLAAAVAVIYFLGTALFSAARMEPLFYPFFRSLFHTNEPGQLFFYLSIIRWTAHYMEYFVVFLVLVRLVRLRPATALLLCLILAGLDEGHQYFLPQRSCSLRDIKYDAAGAATAFILTIAAKRLRGPAASEIKAVAQPPAPV